MKVGGFTKYISSERDNVNLSKVDFLFLQISIHGLCIPPQRSREP